MNDIEKLRKQTREANQAAANMAGHLTDISMLIHLGGEVAEYEDVVSAVMKLKQERDQLRDELERERMRVVACGVVALADTPESAKTARQMHPDYESASCSYVARRVDGCIALREKVKLLEKGLVAVKGLIDDSYGVSGLHLNGDVAGWDSLRTGGEFEGWLVDFDAALDATEPKP